MSRRNIKTNFEESAYLNNATYSSWFIRLYAIAISCFEWINLPKTIDARYLEQTLFWNSASVYFRDDDLGDLALPVVAAGMLNVYAIPVQRTAIAYNGYQNSNLSDKNSVIIYNNYTRTPDAPTIKLYAQRLYEIERAIDVNVRAQKTPVLLTTKDESQRLSLINAWQKIDGNQPLIAATKDLNQNIHALNIGAPYVADKLNILKRQYFQEALTYLGVEANSNEKAERLVTGEVSANMGGTESQRLTRLNARKQACEMINDMFGYKGERAIDVRFNSNLALSEIMENGGVNRDEPVYNTTKELL